MLYIYLYTVFKHYLLYGRSSLIEISQLYLEYNCTLVKLYITFEYCFKLNYHGDNLDM